MRTKNNISLRILKWTGLALSLLIVLILVATWFINREPVQKRIRSAVADRTGDILTFQHLRLSLFPRPGLTLSNATLNVPARATGTIRFARVYPEILPLIRGDVLIAKVLLETPDITVRLVEEPGAEREDPETVFAETREELESVMKSLSAIAPGFYGEVSNGNVTVRENNRVLTTFKEISGSVALVPKGLAIRLAAAVLRWGYITVDGTLHVGKRSIALRDFLIAGGQSSFSGRTARFRWRKTPYLAIRSGKGEIFLDDIDERRALIPGLKHHLRNVRRMKGIVRFTEVNYRGPLFHKERWKMDGNGTVESIFVDSALIPRPVRISRGEFRATTTSLSLTNIRGSVLDSSIGCSAELSGSIGSVDSADLTLQGGIGPDTVRWASKTFSIPPHYIVRTPLLLSGVRFTWKKGPTISISGRAAFRSGPAVSVDLRRSPGELLIRRLFIEDKAARASLTLRKTEKLLDLGFQGNVTQDTLDRIFEQPSVHYRRLRGDVRIHVLIDRPRESTAQGFFEGSDLFVLPGQGPAIIIKKVDLRAKNRTINLNTLSLLWGDLPVDLKGRITASEEAFFLDLDMATGSINNEVIRRVLALPKKEDGKKRSARHPVQGIVRVTAKDYTLGRYTFSPVNGEIALDRNSVRVKIIETTLCGVSIPGNLQPFDQEMLLYLKPSSSEQPLEPVIGCFRPNERITGTFNLQGVLRAKGKPVELVRHLQGRIEFTAKNGKIYRYPLLGRIFAFLNVTELLRGKLPDMGRDGFAYKSIKIKGDISNGKLVLREAAVEGATLNLAADGEIDFVANRIKMTVLVAPFKTIEYILSKIPLVRNILANRLITVPVEVTGDLQNPDIIALSPEAIGENVLDIMRDILELPFKVLSPLFGGDR